MDKASNILTIIPDAMQAKLLPKNICSISIGAMRRVLIVFHLISFINEFIPIVFAIITGIIRKKINEKYLASSFCEETSSYIQGKNIIRGIAKVIVKGKSVAFDPKRVFNSFLQISIIILVIFITNKGKI